MSDQPSRPEVLVTGGSGFVGGHLVKRLLRDGCRVRLLVRSPASLPEELALQCEIVPGELANTVALSRAVCGVSIVFHCAANVKTWDSWDSYHKTNVEGVRNLLEAIAQHVPNLQRLVHVSTTDVYGFQEQPCNELSPTGGGGFGYGSSKLQGEALVSQYCRVRNLPFTIIRPTNVIGPESQFIQRVGSALNAGLMLTVDQGRCDAGILYVDNLVDILIWAAGARQAVFECYNVCGEEAVSWAKFINAFKISISGCGRVVDLPYGVAMAVARCMQVPYKMFALSSEPMLHPLLVNIFGRTCGHDSKKIRAHSKLTDKIAFEEALKISVLWFNSQRWLQSR